MLSKGLLIEFKYNFAAVVVSYVPKISQIVFKYLQYLLQLFLKRTMWIQG